MLTLKSNEMLGAKRGFYFISWFHVIEVLWENIPKYRLKNLLLQQIKHLNCV